MQIIFKSIQHNPQEIIMGQYIWFYPCDGVDAISVTANSEGFTAQNRVGQFLEYTQDDMVTAANICNSKYEIAVLNKRFTTFFLVPQTRGQKDSILLIQDLVNACNALEIKTLHFTHYGFVQKKLPENEIIEIFKLILNPKTHTTLESIVWDIDLRAKNTLKIIYKDFITQLTYTKNKIIWL